MAKAKHQLSAADQEYQAPHLSSRSASACSSSVQRLNKTKSSRQANMSLQEMELKAHELAKINIREALDLSVQVLQLKREHYGTEDTETKETELDVVELSNRIAQELAQQGRIGEMTRYINHSNELTQHALQNPDQNARRLFLRAQMYNAMTCQAKAKGDVRMALKYCEKSLSIMLHLNMLDQLPTCYLNVCALYSTLGLHAEALKHAFLALQILRELIKNIDVQADAPSGSSGMLPSLSSASLLEQGNYNLELQNEPASTWIGFEDALLSTEPGVTHSRLTTLGTQLAITYFNIAVEQEYLLDFPTCIRTYQVAVTTAEDFLGADSPLTKKFKRTLKKAMKDEGKLQAAADRDDQNHKKQSRFNFGPTSVASVHAVYKANVYPESGPPAPASAPPSGSSMPRLSDRPPLVTDPRYGVIPMAVPPGNMTYARRMSQH